MNVALIIAGGSGKRFGADRPKQYVEVMGKPIIIHCLDNYEKSPDIDAIEVVCRDEYRDYIWEQARKFGITKLRWMNTSGAEAQDSIRNGVYHLEDKCSEDDIVVIHDGIRPLVDASVLTDVIRKCEQYGNGVTSMPYNEQIFIVDDELSTTKYIPRETLRRVQTPQAYKYGMLDRAYHRAFEEGIGIKGSAYTNTMMVELGERLYFAAGSDKNIKLTTKDDLELFKAYLKMDPDNWLK